MRSSRSGRPARRWASTSFEEPARALTRNAIIIAVGFSPLLFAALIPYVVVGMLLVPMMALSWLATLIVLPGIVHLFDARLPRAPAPSTLP